MRRKRHILLTAILTAALAALLSGCGWDSSPSLYIPSDLPTAQAEGGRRTPEPSAEETVHPGAAGTPAPEETAEETVHPGAAGTPAPDGTVDPDHPTDTYTPVQTPDPHLIGLWEFTRSTYKGATISAKEAGHSIVIRFYEKDNSATVVFDNQEYTGLKYTLHGSSLTVTVYSEPWLELTYDGTYLIWEQEAFGDVDEMFFERTGD